MDNEKGGCLMQSESDGLNPNYQKSVPVSAKVLATALHQAEVAAREVWDKIESCQKKRDDLVRQLSAQQEILDRLHVHFNSLTRHVRELMAARDDHP
jgi:hypothetical protein